MAAFATSIQEAARLPGWGPRRERAAANSRALNHSDGRKMRSAEAPGKRCLIVKLADVILRVELDAELIHEVELRFEEVDVSFLVVHQLLEHIARHVILDRVAVGGAS